MTALLTRFPSGDAGTVFPLGTTVLPRTRKAAGSRT